MWLITTSKAAGRPAHAYSMPGLDVGWARAGRKGEVRTQVKLGIQITFDFISKFRNLD